MSNPHVRKGRHAAPGRPVARRLAVTAAALAAGAVPLAAAGSAAAATAPQGDLSTPGLPNAALPLGLPESLGPLAAGLPVAQGLPVSRVVDAFTPPLDQIMQFQGIKLNPGWAAQPAQAAVAQPAERAAVPDAAPLQALSANGAGLSDAADRMLSSTTAATQAVSGLTSALPLSTVVPQLASADGGALQLAPKVLQDGALGELSNGVSPQTDALTGGLVGKTQPLVSRLHTHGVPTVGELTNNVSSTNLPVVGTVGSLTQTLPVSGVLGNSSPVTGALQNVSGL